MDGSCCCVRDPAQLFREGRSCRTSEAHEVVAGKHEFKMPFGTALRRRNPGIVGNYGTRELVPGHHANGRHPRPRRQARLRRVIREADEPVFHARWEARVFGMASLAAAAARREHRSLPPRNRAHRSRCLLDATATTGAGSVDSRRDLVEPGVLDAATITARDRPRRRPPTI